MFADCHPSANAWQDKGKLSAVGLSNPVHTNTGQQTNNKTNDAQLLLEVENQLIQDGGNWDYSELKTSCQNCDRGRTGFIGNKEVCGLRARSIQPNLPEISVQNSMDRFVPTGKVSKKRVHLLRWSSFPGQTGWNFG